MTFLPGSGVKNYSDSLLAAYRPAAGGVANWPIQLCSQQRAFTVSGQTRSSLFTPTITSVARCPTIRNMECYLQSAGSAVTAFQMGIWDAASGNLLASCPDISGALAVGSNVAALSVSIPFPSLPFYAGIFCLFTTTSPAMATPSALFGGGSPIGTVAPFPAGTLNSGSFPNPMIPGNQFDPIFIGLYG